MFQLMSNCSLETCPIIHDRRAILQYFCKIRSNRELLAADFDVGNLELPKVTWSYWRQLVDSIQDMVLRYSTKKQNPSILGAISNPRCCKLRLRFFCVKYFSLFITVIIEIRFPTSLELKSRSSSAIPFEFPCLPLIVKSVHTAVGCAILHQGQETMIALRWVIGNRVSVYLRRSDFAPSAGKGKSMRALKSKAHDEARWKQTYLRTQW